MVGISTGSRGSGEGTTRLQPGPSRTMDHPWSGPSRCASSSE